MQRTLITLLFLIGSQLVFCQSNDMEIFPRHELTLTIGLHQSWMKDSNFSPLNYKGRGALYGLEYRLNDKANKGVFVAGLSFGTGTYRNNISDVLDTKFILGDFSLGYLSRTNDLIAPTPNFAFGGRYHFNINYLDWGEQDAFSFLANHGFEFATSTDYRLNEKHRFQAQLSLPIFSYTVRPPYNGSDEELTDNNDNHPIQLLFDGSWSTFNRLLMYDLELKYHYQVSNNFSLNLAYLNRYQNVTDLHKFVQMQNQFKVGTSFQF
ncbi:MAG: hypothetical protein AAGG68_02540 [Bacteroidota bacterium]